MCGPGAQPDNTANISGSTAMILTLRLARLQHLTDAGQRAAGADAGDEDVNGALRVVPDFLRGGAAVDLRIGGVLELLRHDRPGRGGDKLVRLAINVIASVNAAAAAMMALSKAYDAIDGSLAEINPFILTKDGKVFALDAKINIDDNALYRHKDLLELRDLNEEDPLEVEASRFGLNYIKLDGNIACMVNGAGFGDGHHGHYQVRGRPTGELPGCRRRSE